jgi:secondary thiamine-phosphate synthase enzyme
MKIYDEQIALQSKNPREVFNITTQIKAAVEKSGFIGGIILVSSLHSNSAVVVNDEEPGLLVDLDEWLNHLAPVRDDYKHAGRVESNAAIHFQSLLLHHQVIVPFTERRLDLWPVASHSIHRTGRPASQENPGEGDGRVACSGMEFANSNIAIGFRVT